MCLFVEQLLPWMATVENSSSDDPYSEDDAMLFDSVSRLEFSAKFQLTSVRCRRSRRSMTYQN